MLSVRYSNPKHDHIAFLFKEIFYSPLNFDSALIAQPPFTQLDIYSCQFWGFIFNPRLFSITMVIESSGGEEVSS